MTREEKIELLIAQVEDWDLGTLISFAQETLKDNLRNATEEEVDAEFAASEALPDEEE